MKVVFELDCALDKKDVEKWIEDMIKEPWCLDGNIVQGCEMCQNGYPQPETCNLEKSSKGVKS